MIFQKLNTAKQNELKHHIISNLEDIHIVRDISVMHSMLFNEDYYLIGYYNCNEWIKESGLDTFEVIDIVRNYEVEHFGKFDTEINSEAILNMFVYIVGEEMLSEIEDNTSAIDIIEYVNKL